MNDFTKEELQYFLAIMKPFHWLWKGDPLELEQKIQSMIDNYCEHEWENICCQCTLDKIWCHKCNKDMGNLKERYPRE